MSPGSPLRSIWLHPAKTIAFIAHENPGYRLFVLPIAAGFVVLPTVALFAGANDEAETGLVLSTLLAFGPVGELLQVFIGTNLVRLTGAWLGGTASSAGIQVAIVWGNVPIVALAVLGTTLAILSSGYAEFVDEPLEWGQSLPVSLAGWGLLALQTILVAWSIVIFLTGIAAAQGFSIGRAALNALLAWLLFAAVIALATIAFGFADRLQWIFFAGLEDLVRVHGQQ